MVELNTNLEVPTQLPPSPFIRQFGQFLLDHAGPQTILDVGCCTGRNSLYLAGLGHQVVGVSNLYPEVYEAKRTYEASSRISGTCHFIAGDAQKLMFRSEFDAVISNEVLHLLPGLSVRSVLASLRGLTRPGGYNAISGYKSKDLAFNTGMLGNIYTGAGWVVKSYNDKTGPEMWHGGKKLLNDLVEIVAQRP